eukprot:gene3188-13202_t
MDAEPNSAAALKLYRHEVEKIIASHEARLQQLTAVQSEVSEVKDMLEHDLPAKLSHQISVPFGRHAFFMGEIQHTNELMVHLGAKYYVECTAPHAASIVGRRLEIIDNEIEGIKKQLKSHHTRIQLAASPLIDGSLPSLGVEQPGTPLEDQMEIRESFEESELLLSSVKATEPPSSKSSQAKPTSSGKGEGSGTEGDDAFKRMFARMEELERLEQLAEGDEETLGVLVEEKLREDEDGVASISGSGAGAELGELSLGGSKYEGGRLGGTGGGQADLPSLRNIDALIDEDDDSVAEAFAAVPLPTTIGSGAAKSVITNSTGSSSSGKPKGILKNSKQGGFKKGFLVSSRSEGGQKAAAPDRVAQPNSNSNPSVKEYTENKPPPKKVDPPAFSGQVMEREAPTSSFPPASDQGLVPEQKPSSIPSADATSGSGLTDNKPMSKFMMKRMGLS